MSAFQTKAGKEKGSVPELFTKHLMEAKSVPRMPHSFELDLFKEVKDKGAVPGFSVQAFVKNIVKDPCNCVVASMGSGNISTNSDGLLDSTTTWRASAQYYKEKAEELITKEALDLTSYKRFKQQYAELHRSLKASHLRYKSTRDKRAKAETAQRIYSLRADLGDLLLEITII